MMDKKMIKQAQQLQAKMAKVQEELASETVEATSGGGAIAVVMNGQQEVQSIKISQEVVDPEDVELLEDMILAAIKEASQKSRELAEKKMGGLTGGLKLPGM
ncbi:MAG: YbaB/EbfC family nucleoid-associated protein [Dehalococcoidia bacterium]